MITPEWKAIAVLEDDERVHLRLYDQADDPFEKHDLAAEHPEVVERLQNIMNAVDESGQWPPKPPHDEFL